VYVPHRKELSFFDANSIRSLINLLPEPMGEELTKAWNGKLKYLFSANDEHLRLEMDKANCSATALDNLLRLRFWHEFNRSQDEDWQRPTMDFPLILGRDIARENFYDHYIKNHYKLIYMLTPPMLYRHELTCALQASLAKLHSFVAHAQPYNPRTGQVRAATLDRLLQVHKVLESRAALAQGISPPIPRGKNTKRRIIDPPVPEVLTPAQRLENEKKRAAELEALRTTDFKKQKK
jgi:hypothetical protein